MPVVEVLESLVARRLERGIGPVTRRLNRGPHAGGLKNAAPDATAVARAASAWWGGDGHWFPSDAPPRQQNRITPLIDGQAYFAALTDALVDAKAYVFIAGWCLTPHIPLRRDDPESMLDG